MATNRIIYNVQDLFFGPTSGESQELAGHHILRRINRVQSVSYDFNAERTEIGVIGKTQNVSRPVLQPPTITLDFNYFLEGVTNERRIGLSVDDQNTSTRPIFVSGFFNSNRLSDSRNVYLVTNHGSNLDVRGQSDTYELAYSGLTEGSPDLLRDQFSSQYGVLAFQNAYVSNYSVDISVGEIPKANVSCVADNIIYFSSGSGLNVPFLDTKNGVVNFGSEKVLIPRHFREKGPNVEFESSFFKPGNITLSIQKSTETGINFHTETLQSFSLELPLEREEISYLGYKLYPDRPLRLPIKASVSLGFLDKTKLSGSFLQEINRDDSYNFTVNCKKNNGSTALRYAVSGAKFDSVSRGLSLGENQTSEMNFSVEMDLDNYLNGIFVSGLHVSITGAITDDAGDSVLDENDDPILYEYLPNF